MGFAPLCVIAVPAAHGPMNGTFSSFTIGTIASDDRRVEAAEQHRHLLLETQLARGDHALGRVRFVVAAHQLELAPPSTPPLALISSIAMVSPRVIASPARADWPDKRGHEPDLDRIGGAYRERREQSREAKSQERSTM